MFSCEIWEIFKDNFFTEQLRWLFLTCYYFQIPSSIENNVIYLFITLSPTGLIKNTVFRSSWVTRVFLYSSKIICLQVDLFTEYNGIMTKY